jgi:hypothetical protein
MKNLTAARDAVGSEEPIAAGGWCFYVVQVSSFGFRVFEMPIQNSKCETRNETDGEETAI